MTVQFTPSLSGNNNPFNTNTPIERNQSPVSARQNKVNTSGLFQKLIEQTLDQKINWKPSAQPETNQRILETTLGEQTISLMFQSQGPNKISNWHINVTEANKSPFVLSSQKAMVLPKVIQGNPNNKTLAKLFAAAIQNTQKSLKATVSKNNINYSDLAKTMEKLAYKVKTGAIELSDRFIAASPLVPISARVVQIGNFKNGDQTELIHTQSGHNESFQFRHALKSSVTVKDDALENPEFNDAVQVLFSAIAEQNASEALRFSGHTDEPTV